jgi:hypothetical protein
MTESEWVIARNTEYWMLIDNGQEIRFSKPDGYNRLHIKVLVIDEKFVEETTTANIDVELSGGYDGYSINPVRPAGYGWRLHDASHDKRTVWRREKLICPTRDQVLAEIYNRTADRYDTAGFYYLLVDQKGKEHHYNFLRNVLTLITVEGDIETTVTRIVSNGPFDEIVHKPNGRGWKLIEQTSRFARWQRPAVKAVRQ